MIAIFVINSFYEHVNINLKKCFFFIFKSGGRFSIKTVFLGPKNRPIRGVPVYWKFTIGGLLHCRSSLKGSFGRLFGSLLGNLHWRDQFKDPLRHSSGDCL